MSEVQLTDLKIISHPKGDLYHALKKSDSGFKNFGEAYFSSVKPGEIKGWKKHTQMTLNLIVILGEIQFVVFDEKTKKYQNYILSRKNYKRLTIPPGFWVAFKGLSQSENLLLNVADIEHQPTESMNMELHEISYEW